MRLPNLNRFFVTGTDTDSGKTTVIKCLIKSLQQMGFTAVGCKPVACGMNEDGYNEDALVYQSINSLKLPQHLLNPVCLKTAISPNIAAKYENYLLDVSELTKKLEAVKNLEADFIFFEGVGGWKVPLNHQQTMVDLAISLQLPILFIVGIRVGCINHALLTWDALKKDKMKVTGWIANAIDPATPLIDEHIATLQHWIDAPLLGFLPFGGQTNPNLNIEWLIESAINI